MIYDNQGDIINLNKLLDYYNIELSFINCNDFKSINGILKTTDYKDYFSNIIKEIILTNKSINILEITNYINSVSIKYNMKLIIDLIFEIFCEINKILKNFIQELINKESFLINDLINIFENYNLKFYKFRNYFYLLRNNIKQANKTKFIDTKKDNNYLNIIKNYLFYHIVLEEKYKYNENEKYLYEILFENNKINQNINFISLLKFHNSYCSHTFSVKSNIEREKIFNSHIINIFNKLKFLLNPKIDEYLKNIDDEILLIKNSKKENINKNSISNIIDIIKVCLKFGDDIYFLHNYKKFLEKRLLNSTNNEVELEFIKIINFKLYTDYYISMIFMINDIIASEYLMKLFREKIELDIVSEKYKKIKNDSINMFDYKFNVMRMFAWKDSNDKSFDNIYEMIDYPEQISIILYTYNRYYICCFDNPHRYRKLLYNYDTSTIDMSLKFDEESNKEFIIQMNLLQSSIFCLLNDITLELGMTLEQISKKLNIPILKISNSINSLLSIDLLKYKNLNENIYFTINFEYSGKTNISIAYLDNILNKYFKELKITKKEKNILIIENEITQYILGKKLKLEDIKFKFNNLCDDQLHSILEKLVKLKILKITKEQNKIYYTNEEYIDSDLESDNSEMDISEDLKNNNENNDIEEICCFEPSNYCNIEKNFIIESNEEIDSDDMILSEQKENEEIDSDDMITPSLNDPISEWDASKVTDSVKEYNEI